MLCFYVRRVFFALVVMVMPCGLTPVDGIDFVDWIYFSMYACAAHVNTPTQTNVQYGAFEETTTKTKTMVVAQRASVKNLAIFTIQPHVQDFTEGGGGHSFLT